MKSMTGFGRSSNSRRVSPNGAIGASAQKTLPKKSRKTSGKSAVPEEQSEVNVSIKAVNGRFLEIRIHLPREYSGFESELRASLTEVFSRGTVDVYINRTRSSSPGTSVVVNQPLAEAWMKSYQELARSLRLSLDLSVETIARLPDVVAVQTPDDVSEAEKNVVKKLVLEAAEACDEERRREGLSLEKELTSFCLRLEQLAEEAQELKAQAVLELERRFKHRLDALLQVGGLKKREFDGVDEQRIAQEVVIHLDRADISEELTRLKEHLRAYRQLLKSSDPQGKKLDFYAQELLREINTIGSKSHIAKLTSVVVEAKTVVEKIRELVQNVE